MSLSTYQKVFRKEDNEFIEELTNFKEEGYNLKFPEYFIWRIVGAEIYSSIKDNDKSDGLDLSFIENAVPEGEGEIVYLDPMFIKEQMELLEGCITNVLKTGETSDEDSKLLENGLKDISRFISLCDFCITKDYKISIGLDA